MYARLPPEPQRKSPQVELFSEVPEGDSKRGISNYLDEYLSAIKVFGYLERPVFHELTRTMQTRRLVAGETLLLEEEQGFCLVVDGHMQIFVKSSRDRHTNVDLLDDDDESGSQPKQGYQLLTDVKNGAPLSSLFTILSLFTEGVKLRYDDEDDAPDSIHHSPRPSMSMAYSANGTPGSAADSPDAFGHARRKHQSPTSNGFLGVPPPLSLDGERDETVESDKKHTSYRRSTKPRDQKYGSVHPDIVARANQDTTIAVIPATAFRRLTRTYPRASAHIVQVILTRLQRVTLATAHAYLGLTSEVLRIESLMNRYTTYDLPSLLRGSALDRLKDKFSKVRKVFRRLLPVVQADFR